MNETDTNETDGKRAIQPGDILCYRWGWEQTNIDWYKVLRRNGDWLTVQQIGETADYSPQDMKGTTMPNEEIVLDKPIRRRVKTYPDGREGIAIRAYGSCSLWDGQPKLYTTYG